MTQEKSKLVLEEVLTDNKFTVCSLFFLILLAFLYAVK